MSEARAKSVVVGAAVDLAEAKASFEPSYETITQKIAYLMSAIASQAQSDQTKPSGHPEFKPNGNSKYSFNTIQRPKHDRKNIIMWGNQT